MKLNKYGYPLIQSEKQYWEEHRKWKEKFNKINSLKQLSKDPFGYILKLDEILKEGVERDLIEEEYYIQKMKKVVKESQMPEEFKSDIRKGKQYIKKKAKELFKKKNKKDNIIDLNDN
jgi:pyruvate dehydrogenase complex dehydrogenase (E1) component